MVEEAAVEGVEEDVADEGVVVMVMEYPRHLPVITERLQAIQGNMIKDSYLYIITTSYNTMEKIGKNQIISLIQYE